MRVHFVLIGEGRSDEGLLPHIERLLITVGATEVTGAAPDFGMIPGHQGHAVADKIRTVMQLEASANLLVIHRDADGRDPEPRYAEIQNAVRSVDLLTVWVAVVPVQETESWLLLDEAAIRSVAGNPSGRDDLSLPLPSRVEQVADAKRVLFDALLAASEMTGRRAAKFRSSLGAKRRQLLEQLPVGGHLERLESWRRFRRDLKAALHKVALS